MENECLNRKIIERNYFSDRRFTCDKFLLDHRSFRKHVSQNCISTFVSLSYRKIIEQSYLAILAKERGKGSKLTRHEFSSDD